ncbi:hypothetical protein EXIGLDRAFT_765760 [Exidia glandulosa HHB12029]|uniref:Beta-glucuronidase C-terminal domain-containing protein n=1 Tax=Exidia glandulosa HHB12029 TaxID=1314781 RepID=A0A165K838_EXIGL|nr:hypothetical protein EXIGLDRAFT_765760 [Exidia glandulosa HHB12029]
MTKCFISLALAAATARAAVSIYDYPVPLPTPGYTYKGWQAYDPSQPLQDPPLPNPAPSLDFSVELDTKGNPQAGNDVLGSFLGISIEMSLAEAVIGPNSSWLRPQFLNLLSTMKERGGPPVLRLGGNTQEKAKLVDSLPGGAATGKINGQDAGPTGATNTPTLLYTKSILEALRTSSDLLGIKWFLGIPMNTTNPPRLEIMETAEPILGDYLAGWQLGNEPDLYLGHKYRIGTYTVQDYLQEFQEVVDAINSNPNIHKKNMLGGPSVCCLNEWHTDTLIDQYGYLDKFGSVLSTLIIEHYPKDNCVDDGPHDPQANLVEFMNHQSAIGFLNGYKHSADEALAAGKPVVLLETNTGSCNGFLGLSDALAAALWATDLAMTLAASSWSHMMLHLGGQAAYYNPFVPPPHNASAPFQWSVGPPMYAILAVAEALGTSGKARVADLGMNGANDYTPGYVIYENNQPARLLFINFMSDPSGAHDYTARVATNAGQVRVRYLQAEGGQVTSKTNITWAGQSFGGYFESDGLLRGEHETVTVTCDGQSCPVRVPGPSVALVFLTDASYEPSDSFVTFATSHTTLMHNTAAVDGPTLQTSNGLDGELREKFKGSGTSRQRKNGTGSKFGSASVPLLVIAAFVLLFAFSA